MVPADYADGFGTSEDNKIQIKFDDKPEAIEEYSMEDVAFLCEVCDNAPGKRCTRCKRAYYALHPVRGQRGMNIGRYVFALTNEIGQ
jgi:hypothetical protein